MVFELVEIDVEDGNGTAEGDQRLTLPQLLGLELVPSGQAGQVVLEESIGPLPSWMTYTR